MWWPVDARFGTSVAIGARHTVSWPAQRWAGLSNRGYTPHAKATTNRPRSARDATDHEGEQTSRKTRARGVRGSSPAQRRASGWSRVQMRGGARRPRREAYLGGRLASVERARGRVARNEADGP